MFEILVVNNKQYKIKVSNTQFKTDKTRSEERSARRQYVLQLNCMLGARLRRAGKKIIYTLKINVVNIYL